MIEINAIIHAGILRELVAFNLSSDLKSDDRN